MNHDGIFGPDAGHFVLALFKGPFWSALVFHLLLCIQQTAHVLLYYSHQLPGNYPVSMRDSRDGRSRLREGADDGYFLSLIPSSDW